MQHPLEGRALFLIRLAIGLAQGLALYALYHASDAKIWPATNGLAFGPLLMFWLYPPLLFVLAFGQMPWPRATAWFAAAGLIIAALGFYDIWSAWPRDWSLGRDAGWHPHIFPSAQLLFFGGGGLLIAHALVTGGHIDRAFRASYATHFDIAWKLAVQLALSGLFVGAFWLLLWLGAGLFGLIKLDFFRDLLRHEWFSMPMTALAVAGALHLTDVRPALVRGARTLILTLMAWLLPLITIIVAGFLVSLPFTGLAPLWGFGHASALLLTASASLIILINAAHQDGSPEHLPPRLLQLSGNVAALLPVPLVAIAGYALFLRVQQYGWTADRVTLAATVVVAAGYAIGYAVAALSRGPWLQFIEGWNFRIALLILAVLLALFTPVADPKRIAVNDQIMRLSKGKVSVDKFDFVYLRWEAGRYGLNALNTLSRSKDGVVRAKAIAQLNSRSRYGVQIEPIGQWINRIKVYPAGRKLPSDFVNAEWEKSSDALSLPNCMRDATKTCDAIFADLDGDGKEEILFLSDEELVSIFRRHPDFGWQRDGVFMLPQKCVAVRNALLRGRFTVTPPPGTWRQITVEGVALFPRDYGEVQPPGCS